MSIYGNKLLAVGALCASLVVGLLLVPTAAAEKKPTNILVRAVSRDAKVMGGTRITVRDVHTGTVLAEGITEGSSGDTELIMVKPRARGATVYGTAEAAAFVATLELEHPTVVEITAEGPLAAPQAIQRSSKTLLVFPGEHVLGEGVLLEIHGFIVDLEMPELQESSVVGHEIDIRATVRMMCGCPTEPGGRWDADQIRVIARLVRSDGSATETQLQYAGTQSTFAGKVQMKEKGEYELRLLALDAANANFGQSKSLHLVVN